MSPVMTQPIEGVMLYRWVIVLASRSLSWVEHFRPGYDRRQS